MLDIISFHGSKLQLHPNPFSNSQFLIAVEGWNRAGSCGPYSQRWGSSWSLVWYLESVIQSQLLEPLAPSYLGPIIQQFFVRLLQRFAPKTWQQAS